jgi:carbonic anhydrase
LTRIAPLLHRNATYATTSPSATLSPPSLQTVIVSCLDHRLPPELVLRLQVGEAPVIRNAGGRITQAVVEDLAYLAFLSEQLFPEEVGESLFEVAVIHHHQCGTAFLADPAFRARASARTGVAEERLLETLVDDPERTVRADVARLVESALIPPRIPVSGHVFDIASGRLTTVCEVAARPVRRAPDATASAASAIPSEEPAREATGRPVSAWRRGGAGGVRRDLRARRRRGRRTARGRH